LKEKKKNSKKPFSSAVFQGAEQQAGRVNIITANKICLLTAPIDVDLSCILPRIHFLALIVHDYVTLVCQNKNPLVKFYLDCS
jgi:hypothetical protein